MRNLTPLSMLVALASLLASAAAWADPNVNEINPIVPEADIERALAKAQRPLFVGASGGIAWATIRHPDMVPSSFAAPILGLHAGYVLSPSWALSFEFTMIEKPMERARRTDKFAPVGSLEQRAVTAPSSQPQAERAGCFLCPNLPRTDPLGTGYVVAITALFGTLGPRVEWTPFGRDGLFVSASAGLGLVSNVGTRVGGSGAGRAGFRLRAAEVVTFSIEGGLQGQVYQDASAVIPYGAVMLRPYF